MSASGQGSAIHSSVAGARLGNAASPLYNTIAIECGAIRPPQALTVGCRSSRVPKAARKAGDLMDILTTLLLLAMLATLGALVVGLAGFFHGGEFNRKYGNKLMQARVALQAVAVIILLVLLVSHG